MGQLTRRAGLAVALCFSLGMVGCAGLRGIDWTGSKRDLTDTQLKYVHFLRWGEYEAASMLVQRDLREAFLSEIQGLSQVRLSDYEVLETLWNERQTEATVTVTYSAYHLHRLIEHRWMEEQVWSKDPVSRDWKVKPDLEKIRVALAEMEPRR